MKWLLHYNVKLQGKPQVLGNEKKCAGCWFYYFPVFSFENRRTHLEKYFLMIACFFPFFDNSALTGLETFPVDKMRLYPSGIISNSPDQTF